MRCQQFISYVPSLSSPLSYTRFLLAGILLTPSLARTAPIPAAAGMKPAPNAPAPAGKTAPAPQSGPRLVSRNLPRLTMVIGVQQGSSIAEAREVSDQRGALKVLSGATPSANRIVLPDLTPKAAPRLMANVLPLPPVRNAIVSSTQTAARTAGVVVAKTPAALPARAMEAPRTAPSSEQRRRVLMARLEADLNRAQNRLQGAREDITEGQQQLSKWNDVLRQAMLEAGPNASGLHPFVKTAQRYAGTPYVWGGESARGFDCSGFIIRVMRDLGYRALPHSAAEQFRYGVPIAESLLKPGDLVFFANTYKAGISHVGIYLGRRRFIHAAGTGKGTIVSTLDQSPYREKYAGSRRLVRASR